VRVLYGHGLRMEFITHILLYYYIYFPRGDCMNVFLLIPSTKYCAPLAPFFRNIGIYLENCQMSNDGSIRFQWHYIKTMSIICYTLLLVHILRLSNDTDIHAHVHIHTAAHSYTINFYLFQTNACRNNVMQ
jgi:hypothetical protein